MSEYSIKMPDMSQNMALAGKTVYTKGMNVTYDENGYAVKAVNCGHRLFDGTSKSVFAPSKDAALAASTRTGYDGPDEDRTHFSDHEFARAVELRRQVASGELSASEANDQIEEIRKSYGYTFGKSGNTYAKIVLPEERPDEVAKAGLQDSSGQNLTASAASVRSESVTQQLREDYQSQLREQQQRQTLQSELEELRVQNLLHIDGKEKTADALLEMMEREEDK